MIENIFSKSNTKFCENINRSFPQRHYKKGISGFLLTVCWYSPIHSFEKHRFLCIKKQKTLDGIHWYATCSRKVYIMSTFQIHPRFQIASPSIPYTPILYESDIDRLMGNFKKPCTYVLNSTLHVEYLYSADKLLTSLLKAHITSAAAWCHLQDGPDTPGNSLKSSRLDRKPIFLIAHISSK